MKRYFCFIDKEDDWVDLPDDVAAVVDLMNYKLCIGIKSVSVGECYIDAYPAALQGANPEEVVYYMAPIYTKEQAIERFCEWVRDGCVPRKEEWES